MTPMAEIAEPSDGFEYLDSNGLRLRSVDLGLLFHIWLKTLMEIGVYLNEYLQEEERLYKQAKLKRDSVMRTDSKEWYVQWHFRYQRPRHECSVSVEYTVNDYIDHDDMVTEREDRAPGAWIEQKTAFS